MTANFNPEVTRLGGDRGITWTQTPFLTFSKAYPSISANSLRKTVVAEAKKKRKDSVDAHNFVPRPDEATGFFPEAVLLREVTPSPFFLRFFFFFVASLVLLPKCSFFPLFNFFRLCLNVFNFWESRYLLVFFMTLFYLPFFQFPFGFFVWGVSECRALIVEIRSIF